MCGLDAVYSRFFFCFYAISCVLRCRLTLYIVVYRLFVRKDFTYG